jgi:hypothetical protein
MEFTHIIPGLDSSAPAQLQEEFGLTIRSLEIASEWAEKLKHDVHVVVADFLHEPSAVAHSFARIPVLTADVQGRFPSLPRLPFLKDALRLQVQSDWVIYSQADIIVAPFFYERIATEIDKGFSSFSINRRTVKRMEGTSDPLAEIWSQVGITHKGTDCVVMPADTYQNMIVLDTVIGLLGLGRTLLLNMAVNDVTSKRVKDWGLTFHIEDRQQWSIGGRATIGKDFNQKQFLGVVDELVKLHGKAKIENASSLVEIPSRHMK